jgi:putative tryptophan/tyrosine transport system substrate-binding protein
MQFDRLKRRDFITLLGGAAAAWPLGARAQQRSSLLVVGFLGAASSDLFEAQVRAFNQGLVETGYIEGHNVAIEFRWAEGRYDRLRKLAAELIGRQVRVIATSGGTAPAVAAKSETNTIPIIFVTGADQVQQGLVPSLNRPGGNLTGVYSLSTAVAPKRVELLHEVAPGVSDIALLVNPDNPNTRVLAEEIRTAARTLGLRTHILEATSDKNFDAAFASLADVRAGGLIIGVDAFFISRGAQLGALTLRHAIPAIFQFRPFVAAGGLMSYGNNIAEPYLEAGRYTGRILRGEKLSDLPVQQVTKLELIINLKTANALNLITPPMLLARADEVIE